jgi:outer membrane receptor for ferrienterochelin and colicin
LRISFLGYVTKKIGNIDLTLKKPDLNLGKVLLQQSDFLLNEVQIVDQRSAVEAQIDKLVYNVSADPTLVGGDGVDVLRKVPMLSVDMDGNVSLRGSNKVKILLNGQPSSLFSDDVGEALQMFPADEILRVEVITSPGARYDAEGSAGIINIVTKKSILKGINGSVRSFLSNRMEHLNGSIAVGKGRYGFNARLGGRYKLPSGSSVEFNRQNFVGTDTFTLSQFGQSDMARFGGNLTLGAFYDLNAFNSFNTSIRISGSGNSNDGILRSEFSDPSQNYTRDSRGITTRKSINWSTDYTKKFQRSEDQKLIIAFQLEGDLSDNDNEKELSNIANLEKNTNNGTNREFTVQIDYVHPFSKAFKLETGAKTIIRDLESDFSRNFISPENINILDTANTDIFSYNQNVYAAYVSGTLQLPYGFSLMPGVRFEETYITGKYKFFNGPFENAYDNWFPSISLSKKFKDFSSIKISFDQRLSRPSIDNIDPFVDNQDPQNIRYGNPELSPELSSNHEISYSKFLKGATVNLSVYYKNTLDIIESFLFIDENNISNTTFDNIGTTKSFGLNIFSSLTLFKIWQLRGNFNLNKYYISGAGKYEANENDGYKYNAFLSSTLNMKKGWQAEINGHFNSPSYTLQGKNPSFSMYSIGIQKEIWNKKAKVGIRVAHPFAENKEFLTELSGPTFSQTNRVLMPFRSYGISFSYNFGSLDFKSRKDAIDNQDQKRNNGNDEMEGN